MTNYVHIGKLKKAFGTKGQLRFKIDQAFIEDALRLDTFFIDQHGEGMASKGIVLGELTEPKDIAPLVNFIVSGKMDHCVGSTIDVNGGSYLR